MTVGVGVDDQSCTDVSDPFQNMRIGLYTQRAVHSDAAVLAAREVLRMHTLGAAEALGLSGRIGSVEVGKHADLVVVDVRMPPTFTSEGIVAALAVRDKHPETAVMVLSQYVEEQYATELVASRSTGVGYLLKDRVADTSDFIGALRDVAAGGTVLDPDVVSQLMTRAKDPVQSLTPREREVLELMAQGLSNGSIAQRLFVTGGAVEKHTQRIFAKLGLLPDAAVHRRVPGRRSAERAVVQRGLILGAERLVGIILDPLGPDLGHLGGKRRHDETEP